MILANTARAVVGYWVLVKDSRFFGLSAGFDSFSNAGKDLIIQYQDTSQSMSKLPLGEKKHISQSLMNSKKYLQPPHSMACQALMLSLVPSTGGVFRFCRVATHTTWPLGGRPSTRRTLSAEVAMSRWAPSSAIPPASAIPQPTTSCSAQTSVVIRSEPI